MAPSPDWEANRMQENMSEEAFPSPQASPSTPAAKRKKRPSKKSPLPVSPSPPSTDDEKQKTNSPRKERKSPTPPPPPLSDSPGTPKNKKRGSKSSSKSISFCSPRTDMKHRQVASAAAEAASQRKYRRPRKRLHWKSSVRVKIINNLSNYTDQEKLDSWYWPDEYSMMEDECELTSIYMDEIAFERENVIQEEEDGNVYERHLPDGFCERGLESWTMQGEELKEQQVQLVIDTVWQAQIDAWEFLGNHPSKATGSKATDEAIHDECWEFIRERASAISVTSQLRAREFGIMDEQAVDAYLSSVRSLEQSRRRISRMLGGKHASSRSISRSSRSLTKAKSCRTLSADPSTSSRSLYDVENNLKSILKSPAPVMRRSYSDSRSMKKALQSDSENRKDNIGSFRVRLPKIGDDNKSSLSASLRSKSLRSTSLRSNSLRSNSLRSNKNLSPKSIGGNSLRSNISRSSSVRSTVSTSSTLSNTSKKIRYKPKSKTKIPTSPVGSVSVLSSSNHNSLTDDEDLSNRMMRSHLSVSVASEGSSRRRMLRATTPKPPPKPPL